MKSPSLDLKNTVKLELQISMLRIPKKKKKELEEKKEGESSKKVVKPCGTLLNIMWNTKKENKW